MRKSPAAESEGIVLKKEAPEVKATFNNLIMSLVASKGLDAKSKQLTCIAMKALMGDEMAVRGSLCRWQRRRGDKRGSVDAILNDTHGILASGALLPVCGKPRESLKNNCSVLTHYLISNVSRRRQASTSVSSFFENVNRSFVSPPSW